MKTAWTILIAAALLTLTASPGAWAHDPEDFEKIGGGEILLGTPETLFRSQEGIDSFWVDVSGYAGAEIATHTDDGAGLGFDVNLFFWTADRQFIDDGGACAILGHPEEHCFIPADAGWIEVTAFYGADLFVHLLLIPSA